MTDATTLHSLLSTRHSCRAFKPDALEQGTVEQILGDAGRVPSWCNAQPWQVIVTSGPQTDAFRDVMLEAFDTSTPSPDFAFPTQYSGAHQARRRACGYQLYDALEIPKTDRAATAQQMRENYRFFGAPHVALITTAAELGAYGALDCGGFITAFCLAAQARGIATVPQAAIAYYSDVVRAHFDIPEDRLVLAAISFGFADGDHPANSFRTDRADLSEFITFRK